MGDEDQLVFLGVNRTNMEKAVGVPHCLATKKICLDDNAANLSDSDFNAVRRLMPGCSSTTFCARHEAVHQQLRHGPERGYVHRHDQEGHGGLDKQHIDPNFTDDTHTVDYPPAPCSRRRLQSSVVASNTTSSASTPRTSPWTEAGARTTPTTTAMRLGRLLEGRRG
jgi:hypothetical protein